MTQQLAPKAETAPWGILTSLDIYDCNPKIIRDADEIRCYVVELCDLIGMRRFGPCQVVNCSKPYNSKEVAEFTQGFFQGKSIVMHVTRRM
ncbi:MAG: hypothetical protein DRG71_05305 [Deltaproteobacteria bacterium]|nr:MAG: hypothetical protein DRG71_05305 [Deltaproteobacteria bacterium]